MVPGQGARAQAPAGLCYVRTGAVGANDGSSWTDAYTSLQSALGNAACTEIWVAAGTYKPSDTMDRTVFFVLKNQVAIYGGFAGIETDRSQRNWEQNQTILSGDLGDNDSGDMAIDNPTRQDNSYHVLFAFAPQNNWVPIDSSAILDGFIVQGGNANGPSVYDQNGGGLDNQQQSSPTLRNLVFQANSALRGGGMMNSSNSNPTIANVILQNNSASFCGAAMCTQGGSNPRLDHVVFRENIFLGAPNAGKSIMENVQSIAVLSHVDFIGNHGTAMMNLYSDSVLMDVTFINNDGGNSPGGMFNALSNPILVNVLFLGNSSEIWPGGMENAWSNPVIINATFSKNTSPSLANAIYNTDSHPIIKNSILWGNTNREIYNADSTSGVTISNSLVQGWPNDPASQVWGDRDPRFADPGSGDLHLTPASPAIEQGYNAALPGDSLDIDADGDTQEMLPVDLEGSPRVVDNDHDGTAKVDIGAYEFQGDYDAPPTVSTDGPHQMTEGDSILATGSTYDPRGDQLSFQWELSSGAPCTISDPTALATNVACSENGNFTLTFSASDANSRVQSTSGLVVNNTAPLVGVIDGPIGTVQKGATVQFSANFTDAGIQDTHTALWDWGDGTTSAGTVTGSNGSGSVSASHSFADSGNYNVQLTVTDDDQGSGSASIAVVVAQNSAPTADPGGPYLGAVNTSIQFDGSLSSDPDAYPLTYAWTFGDGASGTGAAPTHSYAAAGIHNVCLTVNDDSLSSDPACTLAVVYDPSNGFVTGGGWIDSPAGAYIADPSLAGKATFGFMSKYQKGASIPSGNTAFQFDLAGMAFASTSYEWLVVNQAGTNAQFKGSGLINGSADGNGNAYKFMLWAGDGSGTDGADTFRIRIWSEDAAGVETVVYDNGVDQAIGAGNIVVHSK
jgi:PKD repeat protein